MSDNYYPTDDGPTPNNAFEKYSTRERKFLRMEPPALNSLFTGKGLPLGFSIHLEANVVQYALAWMLCLCRTVCEQGMTTALFDCTGKCSHNAMDRSGLSRFVNSSESAFRYLTPTSFDDIRTEIAYWNAQRPPTIIVVCGLADLNLRRATPTPLRDGETWSVPWDGSWGMPDEPETLSDSEMTVQCGRAVNNTMSLLIERCRAWGSTVFFISPTRAESKGIRALSARNTFAKRCRLQMKLHLPDTKRSTGTVQFIDLRANGEGNDLVRPHKPMPTAPHSGRDSNLLSA